MGKRCFKTLIVEDHDTYRATLKNLLNQRFPDMRFEGAKDGEETLGLFQKPCHPLVTIDFINDLSDRA